MNDAEAIEIASRAATQLGLAQRTMDGPMRWSEDFGRFGLAGAHSAMLFIGSGEDQAQLHNPNFDFPDALTPIGVSLLLELVHQILADPVEVTAAAPQTEQHG